MVSWSLETLILALYVIGIMCAVYIAVRAYQQSPKWGVAFFLAPGVFYLLLGFAGLLITGLVVFGAQFYFVRQSYNWKTWGRIYVYMVLCWAGVTGLTAREAGWVFLPFQFGGGSASIGQAGSAVAATEDFLPVDGGRLWYRRSGAEQGVPVILVHGGPGAGSYSLKALEALGDERPVVRYDQLGAGRSDRLSDTTLFSMRRFVGELDSLRTALGFERVHLIGHGWGGAVAFEYYRAHAARVASLTLASPLLSAPLWSRNSRALLGTLSPAAQDAIRESEAVRDYDSPDYLAAVNEFNERYVSRRPDAVDADSVRLRFGRAQYRHLWGPTHLIMTGKLRAYDVTRQLRTVKVPTLYTVGQHDQADTALVKRFASLTPGARIGIIPYAAHMTAWDNPEDMLRIVREFLRAVESPAPQE